MMEFQTKHLEPDIVVLEITGRITIGKECDHLALAVGSLVREKHGKIIFDLTGVTHIDSTGIAGIVASASQVKQARGEFRLAGASKHLEQILKTTNVDRLVASYPTVLDATVGF
jgi:anti-sigma B factor antagonist